MAQRELALTNPYIMRDDAAVQRLAAVGETTWRPGEHYSDVLTPEAIAWLQAQGYDGVILDDSTGARDHLTYVTFDPSPSFQSTDTATDTEFNQALKLVEKPQRDPRELEALALYQQRGAGFSPVRMALALKDVGIKLGPMRTMAQKQAANAYVARLVAEAEQHKPDPDSPFQEFFQDRADRVDLAFAPARYQNGGRLVLSNRVPSSKDPRRRDDLLVTNLAVLQEPEAVASEGGGPLRPLRAGADAGAHQRRSKTGAGR